MSVTLKIGLDVISSYKRLAYTPWHAIAEFVDNSTQSYFDHRDALDPVYASEGGRLVVSIIYDRAQDGGLFRVADNAMGMSYEELERALHIALPPANTLGRCKYGMGMKTASCWLGNQWRVRTKKLGETTEHTVTVDVAAVAAGNPELKYNLASGKDARLHYTVIEITKHNREFHGRTLGKIKDFLRSMYREDLRTNQMTLEWQTEPLVWEDPDSKLLVARDGNLYKKQFEFDVNSKHVHGWVGILRRGSREDAGFSILQCGRMVRGWPDSWRPTTLYGQLQGSNDLVNQRLVGEINLDGFQVSHTKDDILWLGDEEDLVEDALRKACGDYREAALDYRKYRDVQGGPSETETMSAIDEVKEELTSPEMVDQVALQQTLPPAEAIGEMLDIISTKVAATRQASIHAIVDKLVVKVFVDGDLSPNDPYAIDDSPEESSVVIIINQAHPHWLQLRGSNGVANYLRHCIYDSIAVWQARQMTAGIDPITIRTLKDRLLRVPFMMEQHAGDSESVVTVHATTPPVSS